jgi:hypothetical protein
MLVATRMIGTGCFTLTVEMRNAYKILDGNPEGKDHLEGVGVDGG